MDEKPYNYPLLNGRMYYTLTHSQLKKQFGRPFIMYTHFAIIISMTLSTPHNAIATLVTTFKKFRFKFDRPSYIFVYNPKLKTLQYNY